VDVRPDELRVKTGGRIRRMPFMGLGGCPGVPAAFRNRPRLRFDTLKVQADGPQSEEGVSAVSAGLPPHLRACLGVQVSPPESPENRLRLGSDVEYRGTGGSQ
jgi:hypothetical protein